MTPMKRPAFQQVAGDVVMRRPQIQDSCSSPSSFVHQSTTPPHVSTVVDQGRVSTLAGCVATASPLRRPVADLHRGASLKRAQQFSHTTLGKMKYRANKDTWARENDELW
jgi:hypothetical protein